MPRVSSAESSEGLKASEGNCHELGIDARRLGTSTGADARRAVRSGAGGARQARDPRRVGASHGVSKGAKPRQPTRLPRAHLAGSGALASTSHD